MQSDRFRMYGTCVAVQAYLAAPRLRFRPLARWVLLPRLCPLGWLPPAEAETQPAQILPRPA